MTLKKNNFPMIKIVDSPFYILYKTKKKPIVLIEITNEKTHILEPNNIIIY